MPISRHTATTAVPPRAHAVSYLRARSNTGSATIAKQRAAIREYAASHGLEIVQEYCDVGKEDGGLDRRPAYHQLLRDLQQTPVDFSTILIADWPRWSRSLHLDDEIAGDALLQHAGVTLTSITTSSDPIRVANALLTIPTYLIPIVVYLPTTDPATQEAVSDAMLAYACEHGMSVRRTYHDDASRPNFPALQQLLADAGRPTRDFSVVLTPHPSWWANAAMLPDERVLAGACEQLGLDLHLLHPNTQDSQFIGTVVKMIKQYMSGEYSRELSAKVLEGAKRLGNTGAHLGGKAGFGFRRMLIDQDGHHLGLLEHGTHKTQSNQRVVLVPGPADEIALVNWMYRQIAEEGQSISQLVNTLASRGAVTDQGRPWTRATVITVLTSPRYIGTLVYNRSNTQLGRRRHLNDISDVVSVPEAFPGIVPPMLYDQVQDILAERGVSRH